jgi:hypothetical protein
MSVVLIALMSDAAGGHLMLLTLSLGHLSRSLLLVRYSQRFVIGIDDEDSQEACRVPVTGILTDPVMRAGHLVEAFADLVDFCGLIANLAANGA